MDYPKTVAEIIAHERAAVAAHKKHFHDKKMAIRGNKHMALSRAKEYHTHNGKRSTRTHFTGTGTHLEADKKGIRGYYHGTNVAKMDKKGNLHFRTGGWLTPTTTRRMETFAREHGGMHDLAISRAKGRLTAYRGGKAVAHSGKKGHEDIMTIKR